jgi:phytoene synthase
VKGIRKTTYETIEDLKLYCFRAASTVGLMMSHIMGLYRQDALKEASALGMAMQLTKISRDVKEDYEMGRVYLPLAWPRDEGLAS